METLQRALLSNLGWALALAAVAAIAGRQASVRRRPWLTHVLWVLVLLKLVSPPVVNIDVESSLPWNRETPLESALAIADPPLIKPPTLTIEVEPAVVSQEPTPTSILAANPPLADPGTIPANGWIFDWRLLLVLFWLAGTFGWWLLVVVKVLRFRKLLNGAQPADEALAARVGAIAERFAIGRAPAVFLIPARLPPMLLALAGKPKLILPSELWNKLDDSARETILVHELAHLKRRDHWVRRLEVIVLGLHWWNPIAWWACREVEKAEEQCCDALVIATLPDSREWYAEALLATALFLSGTRSVRPLGASGIGRVLSLRERMIMILKPSDAQMDTPWVVRRAWIVGALSVLILPGWGAGAAFLRVADAKAETTSAEPPQDSPSKDNPSEKAPEKKGTPTPLADSSKAAETTPPIDDQLREVKVVQPIVADDLSPYVEFGGAVRAERSVEIRPQLTGTLIKDGVASGSMVEEGTVLFEIDPVVYELELQKIEAQARRAANDHDRADKQAQRVTQLRKRGANFVSEEELAKSLSEQSDTEDALKQANLSVELAKYKLALTKVKAPISGQLGLTHVGKGDLVVADQTLLVTIESLNSVYVEFGVSTHIKTWMSRMKKQKTLKHSIEPGLPVAVLTGDGSGTFRHGKIEFVDTKLLLGAINCRAALPNPDGELISGESARVRVFVAPPAKSILIPSEAIYRPDAVQELVAVIGEDGIPKPRNVRIGRHTFGDLSIVEEGLDGTEWIARRIDLNNFETAPKKVHPIKEKLPPLFGPLHQE